MARKTQQQVVETTEPTTEAEVDALIAETDAILRKAGRDDLTITPAPEAHAYRVADGDPFPVNGTNCTMCGEAHDLAGADSPPPPTAAEVEALPFAEGGPAPETTPKPKRAAKPKASKPATSKPATTTERKPRRKYATSDRLRCQHVHTTTNTRCSQALPEGVSFCDAHAASAPCKGCGNVVDDRPLVVRVSLVVTVDVAAYREAYGRDDRETIARDVRYAIADSIGNGGVLADGISNVELK